VLGARQRQKVIRSYRDLDVWNKAIELVKEIYLVTKDFPKEETYGLVNQLRRCAVSIPSNIAEGKTRQHISEYIQFLYVALGSCAELETQITIAKELKYITKELECKLLEEINQIGRMIRGLTKNLRVSRTQNLKPKTYA
jgi:four helix bundle protein